jgi:hypothetical protein
MAQHVINHLSDYKITDSEELPTQIDLIHRIFCRNNPVGQVPLLERFAYNSAGFMTIGPFSAKGRFHGVFQRAYMYKRPLLFHSWGRKSSS